MPLPPPPALPSALPWDRPAWLTLDGPTLLANVERAGAAEAYLDLRSPLLEKAWRRLEEDLRRRGCRGYLAARPLFPPFDPREPDGWDRVLAPPCPAAGLEEGLRAGFTLTVGHVSEAIILSNAAQALDRRCGVLVRLRHPDLMADPGPTGALSVLEVLPRLPMLEMVGFFLDQPFETRQQCDSFARALTRTLGDHRTLEAVGGEGGPLPARLQARRVIGARVLGLGEEPGEPWPATLSLEGWGVPLAARESGLTVGIDLGFAHGLPRQPGTTVFVEHHPALVVAVEERRTVLRMEARPTLPSPWRVLLLGGAGAGGVVAPSDWPGEGLLPMLEGLARDCPLYFTGEQAP